MTTNTPQSGVRTPNPTQDRHFEILDLAEAAEIPVARARKLIMEYGHAGDTLRDIARFAGTVDESESKTS